MNKVIVPTYDLGLIFNQKGTVKISGSYNIGGFISAGVNFTPQCTSEPSYRYGLKSDQNPTDPIGSWVHYGDAPCDEPPGFTAGYEVWCTARLITPLGSLTSNSDATGQWLLMNVQRIWAAEAAAAGPTTFEFTITLQERGQPSTAGTIRVNAHAEGRD